MRHGKTKKISYRCIHCLIEKKLYFRSRRDSRSHLSPDRNTERDISPRRDMNLRRRSSTVGRSSRSPESSSCCSSR